MSHNNLHKFATICKNVVWDDSMLKWCPGQQFAKQVVQNDNLQNLRKKNHLRQQFVNSCPEQQFAKSCLKVKFAKKMVHNDNL